MGENYHIYKNLRSLLEFRGSPTTSPLLDERAVSDSPIVELDSPNLIIRFVTSPAAKLDKKSMTQLLASSGPPVMVVAHIDQQKQNILTKYGPEVQNTICFLYDLPKHKTWCDWRFAEPGELEELVAALMINRDHLPRLPFRDAAVVWLGAKPGDCVVSTHYSESASCATFNYHIVF